MDEALWLPVIDRERCTGCGDCIVVCPTQALSLVEGVAVVAEPGACDYAGLCEMVCPVEAIALPYQVVLEDGE